MNPIIPIGQPVSPGGPLATRPPCQIPAGYGHHGSPAARIPGTVVSVQPSGVGPTRKRARHHRRLPALPPPRTGIVTGRATGAAPTDPGSAQLTPPSHSRSTTPVTPHRLGSRQEATVTDGITLSDDGGQRERAASLCSASRSVRFRLRQEACRSGHSARHMPVIKCSAASCTRFS